MPAEDNNLYLNSLVKNVRINSKYLSTKNCHGQLTYPIWSIGKHNGGENIWAGHYTFDNNGDVEFSICDCSGGGNFCIQSV